jgi:hypothetical protein
LSRAEVILLADFINRPKSEETHRGPGKNHSRKLPIGSSIPLDLRSS